ncbi:MAG: septum formation inhibitor Maf [Sphingobacteriia bacterium]|nr:septum formation inhibitor Maf [Sphingobacteriia bacterium]NCC38342.1 septum formation inhibitor Maf [Gammaproteobacteria bacterium]
MTETRRPDRFQLYLASRSPRRVALLEQIGLSVRRIERETDEMWRPHESPETYVRRVAMNKARAAWATLPAHARAVVLAADTAVVLGQDVLGKPPDLAGAARMLRSLSGRPHRVLTAVAVIADGRELAALSDSQVTFKTLSEAQIRAYCETGEPLDKAGGYAIQGYGALFIADLRGSYSGVMGLPLFETGRLLEAVGVQILATADGRASGERPDRIDATPL